MLDRCRTRLPRNGAAGRIEREKNLVISGARNAQLSKVAKAGAATSCRIQQNQAWASPLLHDYLDRKAEAVAREFLRQNPKYYRTPENWEKIVTTLAFNALGWEEDEVDVDEAEEELIKRGHFTLDNLSAAFHALSRAGVLEVKPGQPRNLTEHERRAIALQAGAGDIEGAISRYLLLRAPEETKDAFLNAPTLTDALDEIADPGLARIVREAVWYCWEQGRPNYSPTPERRRFMQRHVSGRIPTARLLDEAWFSCQAEEKEALRSGLLRQVSEEESKTAAPDLESLDDEQVDRLYHATMRKIAEESR